MRLLLFVAGSLAVLLAAPSQGLAKCGKDAADLSAVAATDAVVAATCDCCSASDGTGQLSCARRIARSAVKAGSLRQRCVGRVLRGARHACPLGPASPCVQCKDNAQCGSAQLCETPTGTCGSADGVCVAKPQVCPDIVIPVCGCDGTTYPNDCWREAAGVDQAHRGACSGQCTSDADCNDGNACTADVCNHGICEHGCVCASPAGTPTCCPGPAALCVKPCGRDAGGSSVGGICGGTCPAGASCESLATAASCGCVSGPGGPCGGNILAPPVVCAPGLVCVQSSPDVTGICAKPGCIPFFQDGCSATADCCEPCLDGRIAPCAVCLRGQCLGAP